MFKSNLEICLKYHDPDTYALRGKVRVIWSKEREMYEVALYSVPGKWLATAYFREWEGVKSYLEKIEDIPKSNSAFLAMAKRLLGDYSIQFAFKYLQKSHN